VEGHLIVEAGVGALLGHPSARIAVLWPTPESGPMDIADYPDKLSEHAGLAIWGSARWLNSVCWDRWH